MEPSLTFARHFARLVWLLLNEGNAFDAQLATLRSLVSVSRDGGVRLKAQDWRLIVNGQVLPERFTGTQDLTAQLIGHSIGEIMVEQNASPVDLLLIARVLSTEAVPGDGGQNVLARLRAVDAQTVRVTVDAPPVAAGGGALSNSTLSTQLPGFVRDSMKMFLQPPSAEEGPAAPHAADGDPESGEDDGDEPDIVREQDPEQMFQAFSASSTPKGSMVKLFEQLDNARSSGQAARQLDALVKLATDSSRKERIDIVADVFYGIVKREGEIEDRTVRRQFGMSIRRLCTMSVLKCVVELLPRRKEHYEQYMAIFVRAEDSGVEALVDALVSAPSITDRRVYYDSLLRLRTGIRTLLHMLGDPRWFVVRNAVELLGEMRATEAEPELTRLLEHRDDRVRTAAASALAKLGASAAAKGMRGALKDAPAEVRERAVEAIAMQSQGSVDSLIRAFEKEEDNRVQMAMVAALGQLGSNPAVEKLVEVARTDKGLLVKRWSTPIRVAAVHALGEVKTGSALAALQVLLRDKEKQVRGAASWVLMGRRRENGKTPSRDDTPPDESPSE